MTLAPEEILLVLGLVGTAAYYSYNRGMLYGGEITLTALENAGIIEIVKDGDTDVIKTKQD